jgi:lactobin A/cerein 7B family class IIb bacteriocin
MRDLQTAVELTPAELDSVSGGLSNAISNGLVSVGAAVGDISVSALNNNKVTLSNIANNLNVGVGAAVAILGQSGAFGLLKKL